MTLGIFLCQEDGHQSYTESTTNSFPLQSILQLHATPSWSYEGEAATSLQQKGLKRELDVETLKCQCRNQYSVDGCTNIASQQGKAIRLYGRQLLQIIAAKGAVG